MISRLTPEEEMLARLGTPTCVFCGGLFRGTEREFLIYGKTYKDESVSGISCSKSCEQVALRKQRDWLRAVKDRIQREGEERHRVFEDQLKSLYNPSSSEYRRAQQDHSNDLEEAMNSWAMGNGLFGPIKD